MVREGKCLALCLGYNFSSNHAMQGPASDTLGCSICNDFLLPLHQPALYSTRDSAQVMENGHHLQEDLP